MKKAKFTVIVDIRHAEEWQPLQLKMEYATWREADEVYEHFVKLYNLGNNVVTGVKLHECEERIRVPNPPLRPRKAVKHIEAVAIASAGPPIPQAQDGASPILEEHVAA